MRKHSSTGNGVGTQQLRPARTSPHSRLPHGTPVTLTQLLQLHDTCYLTTPSSLSCLLLHHSRITLLPDLLLLTLLPHHLCLTLLPATSPPPPHSSACCLTTSSSLFCLLLHLQVSLPQPAVVPGRLPNRVDCADHPAGFLRAGRGIFGTGSSQQHQTRRDLLRCAEPRQKV